YMKHLMWRLGVDPVVVPNGLPADAFRLPDAEAMAEFRRRSEDRPVFAKVARWDPDKRWLLTMEIVADLKHAGLQPLLVARGGVEAHGREVMQHAAAMGLHVVERPFCRPGIRGFLDALDDTDGADVMSLRDPVDPEARRVLFRGASTVLANSG